MSDGDATSSGGDLLGLVDISAPNAARMYDYMLGGSSNFAVDREAVDAMLGAAESTTAPARLNRSFLRRAVRFLLEQGIDQFLDLGSGIPTVGNVHEIAQETNPTANVVYLDNEPVAVAHARQLLAGNNHATIVSGDLRDADAILGHPETLRLLDFSRPIGVLMVSIFHFIPDQDDPAGIIARYLDAVPTGSYLAFSHFTVNDLEQARRGAAAYNRTSTPVVGRSRDEIAALLAGVDLVEPGIVWTPQWRRDGYDPDLTTPSDARIYAAVGRVTR